MPLELLTVKDLQQFKIELIADIKKLFIQDPAPPKILLKSTEVCKMLRISEGTLQNLRKNGTMAFSKVGGILYYRTEDIDVLLRRKRQINIS
jgi:hypothetical protein